MKNILNSFGRIGRTLTTSSLMSQTTRRVLATRLLPNTQNNHLRVSSQFQANAFSTNTQQTQASADSLAGMGASTKKGIFQYRDPFVPHQGMDYAAFEKQINFSLEGIESYGDTPLWMSIVFCDTKLSEIFIKHGANPNHINSQGEHFFDWLFAQLSVDFGRVGFIPQNKHSDAFGHHQWLYHRDISSRLDLIPLTEIIQNAIDIGVNINKTSPILTEMLTRMEYYKTQGREIVKDLSAHAGEGFAPRPRVNQLISDLLPLLKSITTSDIIDEIHLDASNYNEMFLRLVRTKGDFSTLDNNTLKALKDPMRYLQRLLDATDNVSGANKNSSDATLIPTSEIGKLKQEIITVQTELHKNCFAKILESETQFRNRFQHIQMNEMNPEEALSMAANMGPK